MNGEIVVYKGYWWLTSSEEEQVAGTLTIESDGGLRLELYGGFGSEGNGMDFDREPDKAIYGRCYAPNGHMKDITLFECYSALNFNFSSSFPITKYTCSYALIGFHAKSMESASFFEAHIDYEELAYWCPPRNIITCYRDSSVTVTFDHSEQKETLAEIQLDGDLKLRLNQGGSYKSDGHKIDIEQSTYLEVAKEGLSGFDILGAARKFERFLSLAMLTPVEHGAIVLRSRDCCQILEKGTPYYLPIELVVHLYKEGTTDWEKQCDMLFRFEDIADRFGEMYKRFCTELNIAQIWSNMIDSLERRRFFTSNDFLVVAQALDGFAIRFRKEQKFLLELQALKEEFNDIKRLKLSDSDLEEANGSRNYYSHILKLEKKETKKALDGAKLLYLTRKLRIMLICCLLNFLGMDNVKINEVMEKCNHRILRVLIPGDTRSVFR